MTKGGLILSLLAGRKFSRGIVTLCLEVFMGLLCDCIYGYHVKGSWWLLSGWPTAKASQAPYLHGFLKKSEIFATDRQSC